jgi:predicted outer membrane repeat protein/parallel beta-helix repeat protein
MRGKNLKVMLTASILLISVVICAPCKGKIIFVDAGSPGANDGSSWADAYNYLQDALADANTAEKPAEILVAQGVYKPDQGATTTLENRGETFQLLNGVSIFGGYAGFGATDPNARDIELYETIMSGDLNDDDIEIVSSDDLRGESSRAENSYQIVTGSGTDETAVLDGFTITGGNADIFTDRNGGGLLNEYGSPQIINCTFSKNSAQYYGGAIYNYYSSPILVNCTFILNSAGYGGGIYNYRGDTNLDNCVFIDNKSNSSGGGINNSEGSSIITNCTFIDNKSNSAGGGINNSGDNLTINNCTFTGNRAEDNGGGIYCSVVNSSLTNCVFSKNSADYAGGGIYFNDSDPNLTGCSFIENSARYGGGLYNNDSNLKLTYCKFIANAGYDYGGGMCNLNNNNLSLNNCIIIANRANSYGGGMYNNSSDLSFTNCTFTGNSARNGSTIAFNSHDQHGQSTVGLIDCILWDIGDIIWINDRSTITISYSNIWGGWLGTDNIDADPLFTDPNGPDNIPGTEDDDLRLAPLSRCVDAGDPNYAPGPDKKDLAGNPRIIRGRVDMGAYEFQGIIYVDSQAPYDPEQGDVQENGSVAHPFDTIQEGINVAKDSQTVLVRPGVYSKIDFMGKAITVAGTKGAAIIEAPWENSRSGSGPIGREDVDGVTFHTGEGSDSVLKHFIIRYCSTAISLNYGSSPTISNVTIVENDFGIAAYENSNPDISNCIFWNNRDGDLFQCEVRYSCLEGETPGAGNISVNPLFVDAGNGDYHLSSEGWRWNGGGTWAYDNVTSLCIDAGDPALPLGDEPVNVPRDPNNEYGINLRINMGAYGGTCQASMPPLNWTIPLYETDPPEPNPARWATNGTPKEVYGGGDTFDYWVLMTATEATDASGQVEYFFECTTEHGFNSGWLSSQVYEVLVGRSGQGLRFRVKVRDQFGNETEWSEELSAD